MCFKFNKGQFTSHQQTQTNADGRHHLSDIPRSDKHQSSMFKAKTSANRWGNTPIRQNQNECVCCRLSASDSVHCELALKHNFM